MNTTHTRTKFVTAAVGAVVATVTAPALLFLGAGTAQAIPDVSERGAATIIQLPTIKPWCGCMPFDPHQIRRASSIPAFVRR